MKPVNDVASIVFKNRQLDSEGHWSSIRIDSIGCVDIVNMTGREFGGDEHIIVTTDIGTLEELMEQWEDKIIGKCESCHHYISNTDIYEQTKDGCFLCQICSENYT